MVSSVHEFLFDLMVIEDPVIFRKFFLETLITMIPADSICYAESNPLGDIFSVNSYPEDAISSNFIEAAKYHIHEHPIHCHRCHTPQDRGAHRLSDFVSQRKLYNMGVYADCLKPNGINHQMSFLLPSSIGFSPVSLLRSGQTDFSWEERTILNVVSSKMEKVFEKFKKPCQETIIKYPKRQELIITDRNGKILEFHGIKVKYWLQEYFEGNGNTSLPSKVINWLKEPKETFFQKRAFFVSHPGRHGSQLVINHDYLHGEATCTLYLSEETKFTETELVIISKLEDGLTKKEISNATNISYETVITHIKNIYIKAGVHKDKELVSLLMSGKLIAARNR
jgi:DNA-binding CsgD family transcriptional regulator